MKLCKFEGEYFSIYLNLDFGQKLRKKTDKKFYLWNVSEAE